MKCETVAVNVPLHRHLAASLHDIQIHTSNSTYKLNTMLKISEKAMIQHKQVVKKRTGVFTTICEYSNPK
jgi:hypothetical protein